MTAKISDLGVARILNLTPLQVSRMTQTPGTPAFMPPEVMDASPKYNASVDVFSLGIMMIHILSGRWPEPQVGQAKIVDDKLVAVTEAKRREVFLQATGNDHPLMDLILKCIDNKPKKRAHAGKIVERLAAMVSKFPVSFANRLDMLRHIQHQVKERDKEIHRNRQLISTLEDEARRKDEKILELEKNFSAANEPRVEENIEQDTIHKIETQPRREREQGEDSIHTGLCEQLTRANKTTDCSPATFFRVHSYHAEDCYPEVATEIHHKRNVLVIGRACSGLSTICNQILVSVDQEGPFTVSHKILSKDERPEISMHSSSIRHHSNVYNINIVKHIGFHYDKLSIDADNLQKLRSLISDKAPEGIHLVLFVFSRGRWTDLDDSILYYFTKEYPELSSISAMVI